MKRMYYGLLAACLALALFAAPVMAAGPYYVTTTGAGNKDGSTWANAYDKIQDAIDKAATENGSGKGVAVFVKAGKYELKESLQLKQGALVYGGFAGTEKSLAERDLTSADTETILDGSTITSADASSVIRCWGQTAADADMVDDSSDAVKAASDDTRLDGFTITGGKGTADSATAAGQPWIFGGGMYIRKTTPTIANCIFKNNTAGSGGAISVNSKASPVIINCRFENNTADGKVRSGGTPKTVSGSGGAILMSAAGMGAKITDCTFIGNKAVGGGAISVKGTNTKAEITNCTFTNNKSETYTAFASNNEIDNNGNGGAIAVMNGGKVDLTNCTLVNNTAETNGGSEIFISKRDGSTSSSNISTVKIVNSIMYDTNGDVISSDTDNVPELSYCAYDNTKVTNAKTKAKVGTNDVNLTSWTETAKVISVDNVPHTVFAPTEALKGKGTTTDVKTDQLGITRASRPSIGAVEYLEVAVSTSTLPSGTVSSDYKQTLEATVNPTQDASLVSWDIESGNLPGGIKLIGDVISGTPTEAGSFDITVRVTVGVYEASKDLTLVINAIPVVTSSPDIGTVSITVKNAVGSNTAAFSVTSGDVKLVTSNDLTSSVKVNATAYKVSSSDATPVFSVNAGNATLKAAYMGDANSDWSSTSDLDALTITNLTAISGQEAISETSRDYYRFQFNVSDDYYFTLELSVLLSGEPEATVTSDEVISGSVLDDTIKSGDEYYVPANGSNNLVTKSGSTWVLPAKIDFTALTGGFSGFISRMRAIERTIAQIITGIFAPNSDGLFTNIGAALSTPVHPGTIFIIRLAPVGWNLPFMAGFERGAMRVAKVEDGAIIGAMTVQNENGSDINEEITTLHIDTSDLRDPDDSSVKVPVPEGAYAISYSTLNGEVYGAFSDDIKVAAANYTPSNGDDDTDTDDEQETSSHGGSSGCNAGFGLFALAALALAYRKFSK